MWAALRLLPRLIELKRNARLPREMLEQRRRARFARLAAHAYRRSPYYRRVIDERRLDPATAVPEDFPVLTKADLVEHFDEIVTAQGITHARVEEFLSASRDVGERLDGRYVVVRTSGTGGMHACCVYSTKEWLYGWAQFARTLLPGLRPRRTAFVGVTGGHYAGASMAQSMAWLGLGRWCRPRLVNINMPFSEIVALLNAFQPQLLSAYPSALNDLVKAKDEGPLRIRPDLIHAGAELLSDADRRRAEEAFGVPVVNIYATTETMMIGFAGPGCEELVLLEDDLWLEIRDDYLLVTNLFNRTMPLIRYRIDDVVVAATATRNGASYPGFRRITTLVGREEHKLELVNEEGRSDCVHPNSIVVFHAAGLRRFQVLRNNPTEVLFRAVAEPGLSAEGQERLRQDIERQWREILTTKRMRNVAFRTELVESIAPDPVTGKLRCVCVAPQ